MMNLHFQPRWSYRDQIYSTAWNNNDPKNGQNVWNNSSKTLNVRRWMIVMPESQETNDVSPTLGSPYCFGRVSSQQSRAGPQAEPRRRSALRRCTKAAGKWCGYSSQARVPEREQLYGERIPETCRRLTPFENLAEFWWALASEEPSKSGRRTTWKDERGVLSRGKVTPQGLYWVAPIRQASYRVYLIFTRTCKIGNILILQRRKLGF